MHDESATTQSQQDYQVLARRYRPQTFAEVLGQESIVTTLKNGIKHRKLAHAYLFCGSRGTGKTTLARILAKALNCSKRNEECEPCGTCNSCREIAAGNSLEVLEIDGASHRGIDDIRQINETVAYAAAGDKYSIYIIDEVHMLTKEAFNALLKTLEEPPPRVKFFFATTEAHKVPATILSRCQRFNLNRIPLDKIIEKLRSMTTEIGIDIEDEALRLVAKRADGGFRDAESLLDQIIAFHEGSITAASVADVLGTVPREIFFQLDVAAKAGNYTIAFELGHRVFSEGKDIPHFVELLIEHFRNILVTKLTSNSSPYLDLMPQDLDKYANSAKLYTQEQCLTIIDFLIDAQTKIRFMPSPRIALEALLLKIVKIHTRVPIDFLVRRLSELEAAVNNSSTTSNKQSISIPPQHLTVDPVPSAADIGKSGDLLTPVMSQPAILVPSEPAIAKSPVLVSSPAPDTVVDAPAKPLSPPQILTEEQQKEARKKQSRYDTLLQFAAVELEGSLQKIIVAPHLS